MKRVLSILGCVTALTGAAITAAQAQYKNLDESICIVGAFLNSGESNTTSRHFQAGVTYVLEARGESTAYDVDLEVRDARGIIVVQDVRANREAIVRFTPSYSGTYQIRLIMAEARGRSLATLTISSSKGWSVPYSRVQAAVDEWVQNTFAAAATLNILPQRFIGLVMRPGESETINFTGLSSGMNLVAAVGDSAVRDIDLWVYRNRTELGKDVKFDKIPMVAFAGSGAIDVRVKYESGSGPALVLIGIYN